MHDEPIDEFDQAQAPIEATVFKPHLVLRDGRTMTTSMAVAEHFGKLHKDVLKAIKNLECSAEFTERNFALCFQINHLANGRRIPYYRMTRDGFSFLAMGFTGAKAAAWKEAYIAAFNRMERALLTRKDGEIDKLRGQSADLSDRLRRQSDETARIADLAMQISERLRALSYVESRISGPEELGVMMVLCEMRAPDAQLLGFLLRKESVQASAGQLAEAIGWDSVHQVRQALQRLETRGLLNIYSNGRGSTPSFVPRRDVIEALLIACREGQHGRLKEFALVPDAELPIADRIRKIIGMPREEHDDDTEERIRQRDVLPKRNKLH